MTINKTNYGSWIVDYYDNALSPAQEKELMLFLQENPALKEEFESYNAESIDPGNIRFTGKESLKRGSITKENIDYYLTADAEGDLTLSEQVELRKYIESNPQYQKDKHLYKLARLQSVNETFEGKNALKKKSVVPVMVYVWRIAAAIIIILGILYIRKERSAPDFAERVPSETPFDSAVNNNEKKIAGVNEGNSRDNKNVRSERNITQNSGKDDDQEKIIPGRKKDNLVQDGKRKSTRTHEEMLIASEEEIIPAPVKEASSLQINFDSLNIREDMIAEVSIEKQGTAVNKTNENKQANKFWEQNPLPLKTKIINAIAWVANKVSADKVKFNPTLDTGGNIAAYELSAGKVKVERSF